MTKWTTNKEKRIILKYRLTLTMKILRTLLAIGLIWLVYTMAVNIIYFQTHLDKKHTFYSTLALEWTHPNITGGFGNIAESEITPLLTQKITYPVFRKVGKEEQQIGTQEITKPLWPSFSAHTLTIENNPENRSFHFLLPKHPKTGKQLISQEDPRVWNTLEMVHEGTVADLAFSTKSYVSPEEIFDLLAPYDLDVLWLALYTGELDTFTAGYTESGEEVSVAPFGMAGGREIGDDYLSQSGVYLTKEHMETAKEMMLENIAYLLQKERKSYYESFLGLYHLQERYDYLKKNGFVVYGAVVTGPVKELLKLKELNEINDVQLGVMEYWNWVE